ncbi:MAG: phosphoenolpyruvate--protein phosphotransferase [Desulfobacterales bacterium]|nr:phosphoenolpyruvate--protein phosphotransferase [Desulfobacterales bacterium]
MSDDDAREIHLKGTAASPGICIGKAYLVDREGVDVIEKYYLGAEELNEEIQRFKAAVKQSKKELRDIIQECPEDLRDHAVILETHMLLLEDKMLFGKTIQSIEREKVNAEWALKNVVSAARAMFLSMADPYLKERASDITHVADRIMRNLVGGRDRNIAAINKRVILVASDLSPAETSQIQLERIKGFITDLGGKASHTSIIARTLEIPAVLGLDNATDVIKNEDLLIVDGNTGVVIIDPSESTLIDFEERRANYARHQAVITRQSHLPAETRDGVRLQVMGNIELPEEVVSVKDHGGDGVGLYRTEFQYLNRPEFPRENELFDKYRDVVEVMAPKPVIIRTLDINGDKALARTRESIEPNPALGLRGIRYCLRKTDVFKTQLRAILRAAAHGVIRVMFPMICHYEELRAAKRLMNEVAEELDKEGAVFKADLQVGAMIEVPSAVVMADVMAEEVDFFSIGTNDLIQYCLAIDRGNRSVAHLYQPFDPAIIRMIKRTADVAREKEIKVFMCGEMAGEPIRLPLLLGLGMDELSMNPQAIPAAKAMIRALGREDARAFVKEVLKQTSAKKIAEMTRFEFGDIVAEHVYKD